MSCVSRVVFSQKSPLYIYSGSIKCMCRCQNPLHYAVCSLFVLLYHYSKAVVTWGIRRAPVLASMYNFVNNTTGLLLTGILTNSLDGIIPSNSWKSHPLGIEYQVTQLRENHINWAELPWGPEAWVGMETKSTPMHMYCIGYRGSSGGAAW